MNRKTLKKTKLLVLAISLALIIGICVFQHITNAYTYFNLYFEDYSCGYNYGAVRMTTINSPSSITYTYINAVSLTYDRCWVHQTAEMGDGTEIQVSPYKAAYDNSPTHLPFYSGYYATQGKPLNLLIASDDPYANAYVYGYWYR